MDIMVISAASRNADAAFHVDAVSDGRYGLSVNQRKNAAMSGSGAYPREWSDCGCPPRDSLEPNADYYRAVEHSPPTTDDFLNAVEAGKFLNVAMCDRLAVSMLSTWEGAVHHLLLFPWKEGWSIATSSLTPRHGRVKDTPSSKQPAHIDWWPFPDVIRENTVTAVSKP
ncbi:MAG: hypothetical protein HQL38_06525 [Alphaproteobacteria bacterium]|nr:hypothetical protein [Alphaproteobacteria bacterium]